jgi:hypothetical protein
MKTHFLTYTILVFVTFFACTKEDISPAADEQKLESLSKEIEAFTKNKSCAGGNDCKVMAMGARPCGGPSRYIVYALSKTDEKQLMEKVNAYTSLENELNIRYNRVSTCIAILPPTVDCTDGVCTVK